MVRSLAVCAVAGIVALVGFRPPVVSVPPAASAPAPPRSSCLGCHMSRAALEPLVKPFPVLPAEGEG